MADRLASKPERAMPKFPTAYRKGVALGAGISDKVLTRWHSDYPGKIAEDADIEGQEGGGWRQYSIETAMQIAIAAALSRGGIPIATGLDTGFRFAFMRPPHERDLDPPSGDWMIWRDPDARRPGFPFAEGRTWLFHKLNGDFRIVRIRDDGNPRFNEVALCFEDGLEGGAFVLEVNGIFEKVARVFGIEAHVYRAPARVTA
jgi:hypothetical protein